MDDYDMNSERDEHIKRVITLQLLECLPKLIGSGISLSDDGNVFSILCRPCNTYILNSNRTKLSHLQQHLNGKSHSKKVTNTLINCETWIAQVIWEKVSLDSNGYLMFERENSGGTVYEPPVESITEPEEEVSLRNTSSVVSVNLSEIFFANTIAPLEIGYLCYACATILNPTTTWEIIVSHLKSTKHTEKLLKWNSTHMQAKLLDIPSHLTSLFSENFLQHKEKEIYCMACSAHLQTVESLMDHIYSKNHTKKVNLFMQTISMTTILNLEENSTSKHFQPSLSAAANCALSHKNVQIRESGDFKPKPMQTSNELVSLKRNHYIIGEKLHCKICSIDLHTSPNILSHINGKKHQTQLRESQVKLQENLANPPKKSSKPQTKDSISDQPNPMMIPDELKPLIAQHLLQNLEKEIYCAACSAHLQTVESLINHTNSRNHMAKLNLFMQAISTVTVSDLEKDSTSKDFEPSLSAAAGSTMSLESCIIGENLYCKICRVDLQTSHNSLEHMNGKKHQTRLREFKVKLQEKLANPPKKSSKPQTKNSIFDQPNPMMISDELKPLISQHLLKVLEKEIYCAACSAHLHSVESLINHTNSKNHMAKLNLFMQAISTVTISDFEEDSISKDFQPSLSAAAGSTMSLESCIIGKNLYCKICRLDLETSHNTIAHTNGKKHQARLREFKVKLQEKLANPPKKSSKPQTKDSISDQPNPMMIPDELKPLIAQHLLQNLEKEIYCAACSAHLQSVESLINHTNSKNHMAKLNLFMQAISTVTISDFEEDSISKDFQPSLSAAAGSTMSLESCIIGENLYCKICRVDLQTSHNTIAHINGKNHKTQLGQFKLKLQKKLAKPPNRSNKTEAIDASTDACDDFATATKISENLFLQSNDRRNIDMNPTIKLTNTERDQKCLQQEKSVLDTPTGSINNDIDATVPTSTSPALTTATSTSITSALIGTSSAASTTPSPCNSSINDSISDQPNLMKIPDELKPLISKHLLQHLETEIYCDTCSAHLQSAQRLVEHTESKLHKLNLNHRIKDEKLKSKLNMIEEKSRQPKCLTSNHSLPDKNTPLKETNLSKNRRKADSNYLSIDINEIYNVNPEKLRIIEMSCQLCFPKSPQSLYCLICEKSTSNNVQDFYEHMFSDSHSQYLADLEADEKLYVDYPNQFSNSTLLKEFMMELTDESFQCLICDAVVLNLDAEILVHIKQEKHIFQKRRLNKLSKEKFLKTILQRTQSYHDNINIYWCEFCDFSSDSAIAFAKHSSDPSDNACLEQRSSRECNPIYDSCVPCASLWLGFMNTYAHHCKDKSHKNNVLDYQIIKEITLPREAIIYLQHAVQKSEDLIQLSDQVLTKEQCKVDNLLKCLETTIKPVFPKAKAYPFGSRMSGLGFPESDIDVFLDCSTYFRTPISEKDQQRIIDAVTLCLHGNKKLWKIEDVLTSGRIPIIKLYHQSTELSCDISFKNGLSVENTKLLKCFVNNFPMVRRLILFLKKWLAICKLSGSQYITNYALCWYVVFYLQSKTILPSVADLIRQGNKSKMVAGWETGISEKFVPRMPDETFLSLLQGFFKYYAMFNFRKCVACPLLGYTVSKDDFADLSSLPPEMAPYINHLRVTIDHTQMFRIDSPMCIQDPYDLAHNLTKAVSKLDLAIFKQFCEASAEVLNSDFKMP